MHNRQKTVAPRIIKGRATSLNPENRFEHLKIDPDADWLEDCGSDRVKTEYFKDSTREILAKNDSPDISFAFSLNPYRGCEHGCIYCYARPTHEFFGLSCGLDFETKILIKPDAPELLSKRLSSPNWVPQVVALSGNTDCYQPIEKQLEITRKCLQVFLKFRNPVGIITKNALILRDIDILQEMAKYNLVVATLSVTTLDNKLARKMEPRTSSPVMRLTALEELAKAGIQTNVNVAPVIPGLNDHEIPAILKEASLRGVKSAAYILLRLPWAVKDLFSNWLQEHFPDRADKIIHCVQETRAGRLNDPCFGNRMKGEGVRADLVEKVFQLACQKYGMNQQKFRYSTRYFRRGDPQQGSLF